MTWHLWTGARAFLRCGSCGRQIVRGQRFARLASRLVRCEACVDDLLLVCPWPRVEHEAVAEGGRVLAPTLPGAVDYSSPSQPWATVARQVADYKAKQARNAD